MSYYRQLRLSNITLTTEQEAAWDESTASVTHPAFDAPWIEAEPDPYDEELRAAYLGASEARERWELAETWLARLLLMQSEFNEQERKVYGRRIASLITVARAAIGRELRRAKFETYEDGVASRSSLPRFHITTWKDDLTRVFETLIETGSISSKTEPAQIVGMFVTERTSKDLAANYRTSRDRVNEQHRTTPSGALTKLVKGLLDRLSTARVEEIIVYAENLLRMRKI